MADTPPSVEPPKQPVAPAAVAPVTPAAVVPVVPDPAPAAVVPPVEPVAAPVAPVTEVPPVAEPPAPPVAPEEKYDLKVGTEPVNPQLLESLTPIFREAKVTTAQAQRLADAFAAHSKAMVPIINERNLTLLRADPQLGGVNFARTQSLINDALSVCTTPQDRKSLEDRGIPNDPALVRMFHRIGTLMRDAPLTEAGPRAPEKLPTQSKLYGGKDLVSSAGRA